MSFVGAPNGHLVRMTMSKVPPPDEDLMVGVDASSLTSGITTISALHRSEMRVPAGVDPVLNGPEIMFRAIDILFQYMKKGHPTASDGDARACYLIAMKLEFEFEPASNPSPEVIQRESHIIRSLDYNVAFPNAHQMMLASIHALGGAGDKSFRDRGESYIYACALRSPAWYSSRSAAEIADAAYLAAWLTRGRLEEYADEARVYAETTSTLYKIVPIMRDMVALAPSGSEHAARVDAFAASNPPRTRARGEQKINELYCATTPAPLPSSRVLDLYELHSVIGSGTFGKVYKGIRKNTNAECAIKVPQNSAYATHGVDGSLLVEVATLKAIPKYAYIVGLLDAYLQDDGKTYIVYELATGMLDGDNDRTLRKVIKTSPEESVIADVMFQITCGVAFLHSYGRVHRDLKPANILVNKVNDRKFSVKVADFGLVVADPMFPRPMLHNTTLWYRSPESLFDHHLCDEAIDVWALGCILVELINAKPAFEGANGMDMVVAITRVLGKPTAQWAGLTDGTGAFSGSLLPNFPPKGMELGRSMGNDCVDLVRQILAYSRITAYAMLEHPFFTSRGHSTKNEPFMLEDKEMHAMQHGAKRRREDR